ncbi:MAG TPA: TolC family protein, partial [Kiritimatiellia bacterium]
MFRTCLLCFVLAASVARAGPLDDLVAAVLAQSPEIAAAEAEIDAARAGRTAAEVRDNPEVSASLGGKSADDGETSDQGLVWSVALDQPMASSRLRTLRRALAEREIAAAEA